VHRFAPQLVLVAVTGLLYAYGTHAWSWVAGPVAAMVVWGLDRTAAEPSAPAPAHRWWRRAPAPVD
jgi:hypothetical protein